MIFKDLDKDRDKVIDSAHDINQAVVVLDALLFRLAWCELHHERARARDGQSDIYASTLLGLYEAIDDLLKSGQVRLTAIQLKERTGGFKRGISLFLD